MMENEFKKILDLLEKLNKRTKKILPTVDLEKEYNNIKDLESLDIDTIEHLHLLHTTNTSSIEDVMEQICYLNVFLGTYVWHIESIRDITEKAIESYQKINFES